MVLTQGIGLGYFTAHLLTRRAPALTVAGIQKSHVFTTSQSLSFGSKERLLLPQNYSIIESNALKQPVYGLSYRAFSTEVTEDSEKERTKAAFPGAWENEQWTLVVGFPPGMYFQSIITKAKSFYKFASALIVPWATYSYATGYISLNYLAGTYGSLLIAPLTLYVFSRALTRMTAYILMEKNDDNILIGYFTTFLKLKQDVIPIDDITSDKAAVKMGRNIQGLILSKKSNPNEWFYLPSNGIKIFDKEKAERIFQNLDEFSDDVYKYKKE